VLRVTAFVLFFTIALTCHAGDSFLSGIFARAEAKPKPAETPIKHDPTRPTLIMSAPPRESRTESERIYRPIANYLSRTLQRPVEYRHPITWGGYRVEMLKNSYDLTFDEPHFSSYRVEKLDHRVLVKLPGDFQYAIVIGYGRTFTGIHRMAGHAFCTFAPPNLGTLVLLDLYENPMHRPSIVHVHTWEEAYEGVTRGRCAGAVLPLSLVRQLDPDGRNTKVLFHTAPMPSQALSAGPRVSAAEKDIIMMALLSPTADEPTAALRGRWHTDGGFVRASDEEYLGYSDYLKNERGFY
jgi:hypothetical protein